MNSALAGGESKLRQRIAPLLIFLVCGFLLFEPPFFAFNSSHKWFRVVTFVGLPLFFSALAGFARRHQRFLAYWPAFSSYVVASAALLVMWLFDSFPGRWLGLDPKAPPGRALVKMSDAVILLFAVIVLGKLLGIDFGSIYLRKGRLRLGLAIGLAGFACMGLFAVLEAHGMGIGNPRILTLLPWILTFVLANGFFEELLMRGLFLKKFEAFLGAPLSNLVTAFIFAIGHAGVTYSADILVFVVITFVFALVWGNLMQKTGALWGSALFHAGGDILLVIAIFSGVKT